MCRAKVCEEMDEMSASDVCMQTHIHARMVDERWRERERDRISKSRKNGSKNCCLCLRLALVCHVMNAQVSQQTRLDRTADEKDVLISSADELMLLLRHDDELMCSCDLGELGDRAVLRELTEGNER